MALHPPYNGYVKSFKKFKIVVYWCFLNVGYTSIGFGQSITTSANRINDVPIRTNSQWGKTFPTGARSMRNEELGSILNDLASSLAAQHIELINEMVPTAKDILKHQLICFTQNPQPKSTPSVPIVPPPGPWNPPTPK